MTAKLSRSAKALAGRRAGREPARATMADVAREAGVSMMTVSRVINGGSASPSARLAVLKAIDLLGYKPNDAARTLAAARTTPAVTAKPQVIPFPNPWAPYNRMLSDLFRLAS